MPEQTQTLKIKCPHCGWVRSLVLNVSAGQVEVVAGPQDVLAHLGQRLADLLRDRELAEANAWIALPPCPNPPCRQTYEVNLRTGATRR